LMLLLAMLQRFLVTPSLVSLGRLTDFIPATVPSVDRNKLRVIADCFIGVEAVKTAVGLVLATLLMTHKRRSNDAWDQINLVDKPNNRHVNR
jgi:hypothetical protein